MKPYTRYLHDVTDFRKQEKRINRYLNNYLKPKGAEIATEAYPEIFIPKTKVSLEGITDINIVKWTLSLYDLVKNAMKKLFEMISNLIKRFANFIRSLFTKKKKIQKELTDEQEIVKRTESSLRSDVVKAAEVNPESRDEDLVKRLVALYQAYGLDHHVINGLNNSQLAKQLQNVTFNPRDLQPLGDRLSYHITEEQMAVFDYLPSVQPFSTEVLKHHRRLNDYFYRIVTLSMSEFSQRHALEVIKDIIARYKEDLTAEHFAREFGERMLDKYRAYKPLPVTQIDMEYQFPAMPGSIDDILSKAKGKRAIQEVRTLLLPDAQKAKTEYSRHPLTVKQSAVLNYVKELNKTLADIQLNQSHLFPSGEAKIETFMIQKSKLEQLLKEAGVDNNKQGRKIGETVIGGLKAINQFTVRACGIWLSLSSSQVRQLNRELEVLRKLIPVIK